MFIELIGNLKDFIYNRPLNTGLGDRFGVLLGLSTIGNIYNKKVHYYWSNSSREDRIYDIDIIKKNVIIPNIIIDDEKKNSNDFFELIHNKGGKIPCGGAYDCIPDLIPNTFDNISVENSDDIQEFVDGYFEVAEKFDITIGDILEKDYIALHIRGADKRQLTPGCYNMEFVNNTSNIVNLISKKFGLPVLIFTDDIELKKVFNIDNELKYENTFTNKTERDLYELKLIMNSKCIIQYSPLGWSSYSNIASLLRKVPLINTCGDNFSRITDFKNRGSKLDFWFNHNELVPFISSIEKIKNIK